MASTPHGFELVLVAQRVHRLPEAQVVKSRQLTFTSQPFHRFTFPDGVVAFDIVDYFGRQNKKPAIDVCAVACGLLAEICHHIAGKLQRAKAPWRRHRGDRREPAFRLVESQQLLDVDVRDAITIGEEKIMIAKIFTDALDATARHRVQTRFDQDDLPVLRSSPMNIDHAGRDIYRDVAKMETIIDEEFLYQIALIA